MSITGTAAYVLTIRPADGEPVVHAPAPVAELLDLITAYMTEHFGALPPVNLPGSLAHSLADAVPGTEIYDAATGATFRLEAFTHDPYAPTPGLDAEGRVYAVGDTVESVGRARTGARRGMAAAVGTVTAVEDGRPVVLFSAGDEGEFDVRPDLFRITARAV
ncbi:hypothetical protein ACH4S8_37985 [Streptomyces sp. NPDC021080]|uniref:hypothetical protein n=1 Tax=Streptomyces sp. NPDC021080 TaxID=3365110 RepID=UPI0037A3A0AE